MAFKSIEQYNEEKYNGKFILRNDGDYADVIFLYRSTKDAMVADAHYIKSADYSGYVQCSGRGCPACANKIRVQSKLFIPLYNLNDKEIQFWDRNISFESKLMSEVFAKYPNPSEFVFRITRHGAVRDVSTSYQILAVANNNVKSYDEIASEFGLKFPDSYEKICRDVDAFTLSGWLNSAAGSAASPNSDMPDYVPVPRVTPETAALSSVSTIPTFGAAEEEIEEEVDFG